MMERDDLINKFQNNQNRLRAVAERLLGSPEEADDAVQEAWLRLNRSAVEKIENLEGWLTTVVAHICLDMLRGRRMRKEESLDEKINMQIERHGQGSPEDDTLLANSLGPALVLLLNSLSPAERVAFVLHDIFDLPFNEIAPIVDRTEATTRQLASRARRRIRGEPVTDVAESEAKDIVSAFLAASREGNFSRLINLLDPEIVLRADDLVVKTAAMNKAIGAPLLESELKGSRRIARAFQERAKGLQLAKINCKYGAAWVLNGKPKVIFVFLIRLGRIIEIDVIMEIEDIKAISVELIAEY